MSDVLNNMSKFLNVPGVISDPPEHEDHDKLDIVLSREAILSLIAKKEDFFDAVPQFNPLRRAGIKAIKKLEEKGLINTTKPPARVGCSSCMRKTLATVFRQLLSHVQTLMLLFNEKDMLPQVGYAIRAYLGADQNRKIIIYLRTRTDGIHRLEF